MPALRFSTSERCSVCRRPLKDLDSIERGMGPTCAAKLAAKSVQLRLEIDRQDKVFNDTALQREDCNDDFND